MAKGSGGVGKKSGSVSGAGKGGAVAITAASLAAAAKSLPASDKFHGRAFLGPLMAKLGTTPQAQASNLIEMHMDGKITLSRADLVEAMNPKTVASSEIRRGNYAYHLIEFD